MTERERPDRRHDRGAATRERLLAAASRRFAEQGFDATSVEAISTDAGITVPGMYRHFRSKAAVLLSVAQRATKSSAARRALGTGPDLAAELADLFAEYLADGELERRRLSIELSRAAFSNDELRASVVEYNRLLRMSLLDTMAASSVGVERSSTEADLLAHLVLVLLMGAIHIDTLDAHLIGDRALVAHLRLTFQRLLRETPSASASATTATPHPHPLRVTVDSQPLPGPTDGRQRRSVRTRGRILDAAAELFALRGYDATTTDMIASKAEISVPGLYRHVASKEELLVAVGERAFATYRLATPLDSGTSTGAHLAALAASFVYPHDQVNRRLAIELDFGAWRSPALATALRDYHRRVRHNVAEAIAEMGARGSARERDLSAMVVLMLFMGSAHVDTVDPSLVGSVQWAEFVSRRLPQIIGVSDQPAVVARRVTKPAAGARRPSSPPVR